MSKKIVFGVFIGTILLASWFWWSYSNNLSQEIENLNKKNLQLIQENTRLQEDIDNITRSYQQFIQDVQFLVEDNHTAITIAYSTNFSKNPHYISFSVPYKEYRAYNQLNHPIWNNSNLTPALDYITTNVTIIDQIVNEIKNQTESEEELANALLNFVQDKRTTLNIRYYPTKEMKYPIETLVEMGGNCDSHTILFLTLMKTAGFKCILLYSNEMIEGQYHTAVAVKLKTPPKNLIPGYNTRFEIYDGDLYYYAETTKGPINIGNIPTKFENLNFTKFSI